MRNIIQQHKIDRAYFVRQTVDFQLFGSKRKKSIVVMLVVFALLMIVNAIKYKSTTSYWLCALYLLCVIIVYAIPVVRGMKAAALFSRKSVSFDDMCFLIEETSSVIKLIVLCGDNIVSEQEYNTADCTEVSGGLWYVFLWFGNRSLSLRKDDIIDVWVQDRFGPDNVANNKHKGADAEMSLSKQSCFHGRYFHGVMAIVGIIFGSIIGFRFLQQETIPISGTSFMVRIIILGGLSFFWMSYAWISYKDWLRQRSVLLKIISIVLFPVTLFCFMIVGAIRCVTDICTERELGE